MQKMENTVRQSTLGIFYSTIFICGVVNSKQDSDGTTFPVLLQETWHITPSSNQIVTLIDFDDHVAFYHDSIIENYTGRNNHYYKGNQWPFSELSTAWKYVKDTYGPIGSDPRLFLILHGNNSLNSSDQKCSNQSFLNPNGGGRNLIDCHFPTLQFNIGLLAKTVDNFETIFPQISDIIRYGAKGMYNDADRKICGSAMSDILFYDIYRHLRLNLSQNDVTNWKEKMKKPGARWDNRQKCFNGWFIPIYEKYGEAFVLNRYFELTKLYWQRTGRYGGYEAMNLGEFIHFWSGVTRDDLHSIADKVFEWTQDLEDALLQARDTYQFVIQFNYTVMAPKSFLTVRNETLVLMETEDNSGYMMSWNDAAYVFVFIVIILIVLMLCFYIVRNKSKLTRLENWYRELTVQDVNDFRVGSKYMNLEDADSDLSILCMPFNMAFEVPAERIAIDKSRVLGQGEFGIVYLGILKGESERPDVKVAVKKPKLETQLSHFKEFLSEIKIMAHLEKHENIAALLATVTHNIRKGKVIAALEFCEKGDLLDNLRKCRRSFRSLWSSQYSRCVTLNYIEMITITQPSVSDLLLATETENTQEITTVDLISWAAQIANGMLYLSSKNIIHGDLAARNVLLTADNIPKISDFGLSRQLLKYSNYHKTSSTPIPWKWLAIESLTQKTFSIQSDVWSFGVTLWEIFTLGQEPYPGRSWDKTFEDDLIAGDGLIGEPEFGNSEIHDLMMNCMKEVPAERFSFARIKSELEKIKGSPEA